MQIMKMAPHISNTAFFKDSEDIYNQIISCNFNLFNKSFKKFLNKYNNDLNKEIFSSFLIDCSWCIAEMGEINALKIVFNEMGDDEKRRSLPYILQISVRRSEDEMFFDVIDLYGIDAFKNKDLAQSVFYEISTKGTVAMAKKIIKYVNPKYQQSVYIRNACVANNYKVVDYLLPFSNINAALKYMKERKTLNENNWGYLQNILNTINSKNELKDELKSSEKKAGKIKKI